MYNRTNILNINNGDNMYYINTFFVLSILGHFIENIFYTSRDSGILFGYWTPIYGLGTIITIYVYNLIKKKYKLNNITKIIISFLIGFIILTVLEFIGGYLIERLLKISFWNYEREKFNIGKYTSLKMAFIWGISSIVIIYVIKPLTKKINNYIPKFITYILITLYVIDSILTLAPYLI